MKRRKKIPLYMGNDHDSPSRDFPIEYIIITKQTKV